METRTWLFVALLVAACVPLILADETNDTSINENGRGDGSNSTTEDSKLQLTNSSDTDTGTIENGTVGDDKSNTAGEGPEDKQKDEPLPSSTTEPTTITSEPTTETVTKKDFDITGVRMKSYLGRNFNAFCRIRYAEAPIEFRRFKLPQELSFGTGSIDATNCEETPVCMQILWHKDEDKIIGEEDCLFLNVYEPVVESTNLPVIVYFHGGGFFSGSGTFKDAGPHYFMDQDVVFVTVNYRLGPFGFFSLNDQEAPGNMGLYDQRMALKWVQRYIGCFHGDRHRVTIMGEGAGGASVHLHLLSSISRDYFSKAISQTGTALSSWALPKDVVYSSNQHAIALGCKQKKRVNAAEIMKCMRKIEAETIVNSTKALFFWLNESPFVYGPVVQTGNTKYEKFLKKKPIEILMDQDIYDVPWLVGVVTSPGFFHIEKYLEDHFKMVGLAAKFDEYGADILNFPSSIPDPYLRNETLLNIKHTYMKKYSSFVAEAILQMFNDREGNLGHMLSVAYHALLFHEHLYQYRFEYRGMHSMAENLTASRYEDIPTLMKDETVNEDDLIYLLRRPKLFPDFDRTTEEGKRDLQMMRKLTRIWADFAATGEVKQSHRNKRGTVSLTKVSTDNHWKGLLAELFNRIFSSQRRARREGDNSETIVGVPNVTNSNVSESTVGEFNVDQTDGGNASKSSRKWDEFVAQPWKDKSICWNYYASVMWPAVKRFPNSAGNVPMLPYLSFGKGENDTAVKYCLRYLMQFDNLIHWLNLPLDEVKLPDLFVHLITTTSAPIETTTVRLTTKETWPNLPVYEPPDEPEEQPEESLQEQPEESLQEQPQTEPPGTTWPSHFPNGHTWPELRPPKPPLPPIYQPLPPMQPEVPAPAPEPQPQPAPEAEGGVGQEAQTVPEVSQPKYTWPQQPKPPEPPPVTFPRVDFDLPPLPPKAPLGSYPLVVKPTPPGRPASEKQYFTWTFSSTERVQKPQRPYRPKPQHKPSHAKAKSKAPSRSCEVWSLTSLLLLLLLVVQF